jgi:cytochrome c
MTLFRTLTPLILGACLSISAMAQDHGTKDEAKALTTAALGHIKKVGNEQAFKDFTNDKPNWNKKDLYVFAVDGKGVILAHGVNVKLVGKDMSEMKDQNGKLFMREILDTSAAKGEGWVDYDWANPTTKKAEPKSTFVKRIPGFDGSVAVGIYR